MPQIQAPHHSAACICPDPAIRSLGPPSGSSGTLAETNTTPLTDERSQENSQGAENERGPALCSKAFQACLSSLCPSQLYAQAEEPGTSYSVVGYYHADYRMLAGDLPPVGRKVADKIHAKQPQAVVLVLDNKKLSTFMDGEDTQPFDAFVRDGTKGWHRHAAQGRAVQVADSNWKAFLSETLQLLKQRLHTTIVDFDDHLDDISKDYLNPQLAKLGKFQLPGQA